MYAWRGQDDAGNPIEVIYYGRYGWPSRCVMFVPGTEGYDSTPIPRVLPYPTHALRP